MVLQKKENWHCLVKNNFIINGIALISNENKESFSWIFDKIKYQHKITNKNAETIITDPDKTIIASLQNNMPQIKHSLCIWHNRKNIEKNLGYLRQMKIKKYYLF